MLFSLPYLERALRADSFRRPDHLHGGKFQSFKAVTNQIEHQGYTYCWLVCDGQNAGFCGYKIENGALFLSKLYIEKTFRRKGLASFALEELKKICREKSLGYIWLTVNRDNLGSVAFYRQAGFYVDHDEVTISVKAM